MNNMNVRNCNEKIRNIECFLEKAEACAQEHGCSVRYDVPDVLSAEHLYGIDKLTKTAKCICADELTRRKKLKDKPWKKLDSHFERIEPLLKSLDLSDEELNGLTQTELGHVY